MKHLLIILLFPSFVFSQKITPDTCFTQQQLVDISFTLDSLWIADDINNTLMSEYKTLILQQESLLKLDSLQLQYKNQQIKLLQENIQIYIQREQYLKPKWYDKKGLWFGSGIFVTLGSGILLNQLLK